MPKHLVLFAIGVVALACGGEAVDPNPNNNFDIVCTIPEDEVFFGGVDRDGIPALTNVTPVSASQATISDDDRVLGIVISGESRAYPLAILWWHELANDTLGGQPLLMSYCPLTGSGIAFDPRVDGGPARNFGVSGLLWRSNLTMFDRDTESLWNQMFLGAACGEDRGKDLRLIPIIETDWGYWKELHPNTTIMGDDTGFPDRRDVYGIYPYGSYDNPHNPQIDFVPESATYSDIRPPKELVMGVFEGDRGAAGSKAYPFGVLRGQGISVAINDEVGGRPVLITYQGSKETSFAFDRRVDGQTVTLTVTQDLPFLMEDGETGTTWNQLGEAVAGPLQGKQLEPLKQAYVAFWFAWNIYFPDTELFGL